jgi:iron complex outermembrane receptor protein
MKKTLSFIAVIITAGYNSVSAQEQDSLYKNIEVVTITKTSPKGQNKSSLTTKHADLLNHDAGKFLNSIPEINGIRKAGNYATDPVLRGFKYEQLNIVIDGAAAAINACPSRMDPAISQVNLNTVQEAEIYKGPYLFRSGNAFGGTINFITIPPIFTEKPTLGGRISTGYESNGNVFRNEALFKASTKKIVWDVFGSYQKGDRYKDGNGNEVRSAFLRYNIGTKGNIKWNDSNMTTLQINTNQGRDVEFAALSMDLIYDKTWMYQLKHETKINHKYLKQIDFNSYLTDVKHSMGTPDRKMVSDVKSATYGARAEAKMIWNQNTWYTGLDYKHEATENISMTMPPSMPMRDGTAWQNAHINQISWFNEYQHAFPNSKLVISLRLDLNEADAKDLSNLFKTMYGDGKSQDFNHNISIGYNQNLSKNSKIGIWAGRAQRSGSLTERFINRFAVGIDAYELIGNPITK